MDYNKTDTLPLKTPKRRKKIALPKAAENDFNEVELIYRDIFEHSPVMFYHIDRNGRILNINKAGLDLLGYKNNDEIEGLEASGDFCVYQSDFEVFQNKIKKCGFVQDFETQLRCKNGSIIDVRTTSTVHRKKNGEIDGYAGFIVDIPGRKEAEKVLWESEKKYRTIAENSLSAIFIHQNKRFCYANDRLAELLGYDSPDEIIGQPFWLIVHPKDRQVVKERGLKREKTDFSPDQYPFRVMKKDGSAIWVELRAIHSIYMGQPSVIGNFIDITQSKRAEEEIRHLTQRLIKAGEEERKRIAADIHDEFGQALTALHFDLEAIQRSLPSQDKEQKNKFNGLISNVEKLADVVRKTTSYIRPDVLDHLGLIPALEWYIHEYIQRHPNIKIKLDVIGFKKRLNPDTETVLYRICQECLANVKKHAKASLVNIMLTYSYPWIIFTIKDNGIGYQQSETGLPKKLKTTGIGLPSMKERVASLRGNIDITSAPQKGTAIRIVLPLT
jgi:PAS domain S-box-containing protein